MSGGDILEHTCPVYYEHTDSVVYLRCGGVFGYVFWLLIILEGSELIAPSLLGLTIKHMITQRRSFTQLLSASSSALTTSRFIRLMCLTSFIFIFTIPVQLFFLYSNLHEIGGFQPWTSWDDVHSNFGSIAQIPEFAFSFVSPTALHANFLSFWMYPLTGLVFFFFFGVLNESLRPSVISLLRRMGFKIASPENTYVGSGSL